jgi:AraC-like DNA-binding protein/quercetin dioxygenase-like cupin family protein
VSVIDIAQAAPPVSRRPSRSWAARPAGEADPGWELSAMRRVTLACGTELGDGPGPRWLFVTDGGVTFETATGDDSLVAGDAVLVDAHTAHRVVSDGGATVVAATLRAAAGHRLPSPLVVRGFDARHAGIAAMVRVCPLSETCASPALFATSYAGLIGAAMTASWLDRLRAGAAGGPTPVGERDAAVAAVTAALTARPGEAWTVERMARTVHLSRSTLGERFRRELGRGPIEVLRDARMREARRMLRDPAHPVEHVAHAVGYGSTAAFSRAFSSHHGVGPRAWRDASAARRPQGGEDEPGRDGGHRTREQRGAHAVAVQERAS